MTNGTIGSDDGVPITPDAGVQGDADAASARSRSSRLLLGGLIAALLVAALGVAAARILFAPANDEAVRLVPRDAVGYVNVFLDPSLGQKRALRDLLGHFPEAPTPEEARSELVDLIDHGLAEIDASFEDDVEPWLGHQVAGFFLLPAGPGEDPSGAALIGSKDDDEARAFLRKVAESEPGGAEDATYRGVDYLFAEEENVSMGVVDGFVVAGDRRGFEAAVDTARGGDDLRSSARFREAFDGVTEDRLMAFFIDGELLWTFVSEELEQSDPEIEQAFFDLAGWEAMAGAAFVTPDSAVLESTLTLAAGQEDAAQFVTWYGGGTDLLPEMPEGSWGVLGFPRLDATIDSFIDLVIEMQPQGQRMTRADIERELRDQTGLELERDLLGWMGDAGLFVTGGTVDSLAGGMIIESENGERSRDTLRRLRSLLESEGAPIERLRLGDADGFSFQDPSMPRPIALVAGTNRVVGAYGMEAARAAIGEGSRLGDDAGFRRAADALGDVKLGGYFNIQAILAVAADAGAETDSTYRDDVKPWLEPLGAFAFGTDMEDRRVTQRAVITVD